ncbi:sulfite exporter TauE/SafE family protein [Bacillus sp. V33-4]|uniref:sulfite exporter TauE/SafE family protein n=1 Tax=Bacillus sp. V33-4 TaxID=2054169 RepID=UPI000C76BF1D|nr:sulfite exporter TauE/SafE family protein [Bacillus sp. V33-4]PLR87220.1 sulfite exporter TauE/SafE family protein [Bacillus sp. V33-4]
MEIILYFIIGAIISVLSGFFGVGGGFILTPILLLLGFSPIVAITMSLFYSMATSGSGIAGHIRLKNILWKEGFILGSSGVIATQFARPFVFFLERRGFDEIVIPVFYVILLSYFAFKMLTGANGAIIESNAATHPSYIKLALIGFFGGFISTALGVGGGFIIVPLTIAFLGFHPKKAVGTSLFAVLMIVSVGFISYALTISIDYRVGLLLAAGGLLGSQFGAKLTSYYQQKEIKVYMALLYIATLLSVVLKLMEISMIGLGILALFIGFFFTKSFVKLKTGVKDAV